MTTSFNQTDFSRLFEKAIGEGNTKGKISYDEWTGKFRQREGFDERGIIYDIFLQKGDSVLNLAHIEHYSYDVDNPTDLNID